MRFCSELQEVRLRALEVLLQVRLPALELLQVQTGGPQCLTHTYKAKFLLKHLILGEMRRLQDGKRGDYLVNLLEALYHLLLQPGQVLLGFKILSFHHVLLHVQDRNNRHHLGEVDWDCRLVLGLRLVPVASCQLPAASCQLDVGLRLVDLGLHLRLVPGFRLALGFR